MKRLLLFIFLLSSLELVGQNQRMISYNLFDGSADTLNAVDFDTTIAREMTNYYIGNYNNDLNVLNENAPVDNLYPGSSFTLKRQASLDYSISNYPIRTSIKLFIFENDSLNDLCSGSMISRKHVLTACHCVAKLNKDSLLADSFFVCPALDNGQMNNNFDCSWVKKIYIFENWNISNLDFAVLELEKPIGEETGWLSIGFESNDSLLLDGLFYKFTYPATTIIAIDSNFYNGDTLYYYYGISDFVNKNYLGICNANGIPGESGSSLIKIENNKNYTSYGVLSLSFNLQHSRLTNWKYYSIKSIIANALTEPNNWNNEQAEISVFPVPSTGILNIIYSGDDELRKLMLFDLNGRKVMEKTNPTNELKLDLSSLPSGTYILISCTEKRKLVNKIVKIGSNNQ